MDSRASTTKGSGTGFGTVSRKKVGNIRRGSDCTIITRLKRREYEDRIVVNHATLNNKNCRKIRFRF